MDKNLIPAKIYKKIVELVPIVCVDIIIFYQGKYVLVKRKTEPLKGKWWIPGGRAYKGEESLETAKRKMKNEVGLKSNDIRLYGIYEDHYKKSSLKNIASKPKYLKLNSIITAGTWLMLNFNVTGFYRSMGV